MKRRSDEFTANDSNGLLATKSNIVEIKNINKIQTNIETSVTPTSVIAQLKSFEVGGGVVVGNYGNYTLTPEQIHVLRMRGNLERVRLLCELVKKREKYKKEFVSIFKKKIYCYYKFKFTFMFFITYIF